VKGREELQVVDEKRLSRALAWAGGGGTVLAVSSLITAGVVAATPDRAPVAGPAPCPATTGCGPAAAPSTTAGDTSTTGTPVTSKRVTQPEVRSLNRESVVTRPAKRPARARPKAAKPARPAAPPAVWTTTLPEQHLAAPIVGMTSVPNGSLLLAGSDGGVFPVGQAGFYGSLAGQQAGGGIAAVAADPRTGGYWLAGADGGVFGMHAPYYGSVSGHRLGSHIAAMAASPSGRGYWLASADGGVFAFGDARYAGSAAGHRLRSPVVGMAATRSGHGYWLVSADGGVFAFGDARYAGSAAGHRLGGPAVAIAASPTGRGYWVASEDGGVFAFGDARYFGGDAQQGRAARITSIVATGSGRGYWLGGRSGQVLAFGDARPVQITAPLLEAESLASFGRSGLLNSRLTSYRPGAVGYDISQYQCGDIPASRAEIAVVQITGGALDNAPNPCFRQEAEWAGRNLSVYVYMDGLPSPAPAASLQGPAGTCAAGNVICESYNFGYNYGRYWLAYSRRQGVNPKLWWLDVENYSGWTGAASNSTVIRGTLDALRSAGVSTGIYSSSGQWNSITGGMAIPGEPVWVPGAGNIAGGGYSADSFCWAPASHTFGGGRLAMVQFGYQGPFRGSYGGPPVPYDLDLACP
jgi:hypothetical protein